MLWAMNTGHEGSLSTCHANSPVDALRRLEVMVLSAGLDLPLAAVRDQLASAVDLVVQVARGTDGARAHRTPWARCSTRPTDGRRDPAPRRARRASTTSPPRPARRPGAPPPDPRVVPVTAVLLGAAVAALVLARRRLAPPARRRSRRRARRAGAAGAGPARPPRRGGSTGCGRAPAAPTRRPAAGCPRPAGLGACVPGRRSGPRSRRWPAGRRAAARRPRARSPGRCDHGAPVARPWHGWAGARARRADVQLVVAALSLGAQRRRRGGAGGRPHRRHPARAPRAAGRGPCAAPPRPGPPRPCWPSRRSPSPRSSPRSSPRAAAFLVTTPAGAAVPRRSASALEAAGAALDGADHAERVVTAAAARCRHRPLVAGRSTSFGRPTAGWSAAPSPPARRLTARTDGRARSAALLVAGARQPPCCPWSPSSAGGSDAVRSRQRRARARARAVRRALPELVDLLVLASTAGLSLPVAHPLVAATCRLRWAPPSRRPTPPPPPVDRAPTPSSSTWRRSASAPTRWPTCSSTTSATACRCCPALERTSLELRLDRRRAAELDARRVPVRLLAPLVTCVLPAFGLLTVVPLLAASLDALPT